MVFSDWQDAARALRQRVAPVDGEQKKLARHFDVELPERLPARVAAARLRACVAGPLRLGQERPVSEAQEEYLTDLLTELDLARPDGITSYDLMSAWLDVLAARRALAALERERPRRGDVVEDITRAGMTEVVSSIGETGVIFPMGPAARRIPAYRLRVVARAEDTSPEAGDRRRRAANERALRARVAAPSGPKLQVLSPYRTADVPDHATIELLRRSIENAADERPVQRCIEEHPELLSGLTQSSWGTFVRPQVSLAGQKVPDFLLAVADSGGVHWTLIELESPAAAQVGTQRGELGQSARKGIQQIEDWREWLTNDIAHARDNIGLVDIRPECPGLVLVGRRGHGPWPSLAVRQRLSQQRDVLLHSYDWLLEALEHGAGVDRPGGPLEWPDWQLLY